MRSKTAPLLPWSALTLLFVLPPAFGTFYSLRDLVPYFLPLKSFAVQETLAGRVPWWSPFNGCGELFMTNPQTGLLYPLTWLFLLPPHAAGQLYQFLQLAAAALGMGFLARASGKDPAFAAALGFAYGFSGPMLSCWDLPFNLGAMAWFPWILWGLKAARPAAAAAALALAFLAGEPSLFAALVPLILLFIWMERLPCGTAAKAGLLALPALMGTAAWLGLGLSGAARLQGEGITHAGLRLADWAVFLSGPVLGLPFREAPSLPHDLYLPLPYLGMGLCVFALHGLARRGRHRWYLLPAFLFVLLAMGEQGPLGGLFRLPWIEAVRFPARFLLPAAACLALTGVRAEGRRWAPAVLAAVLAIPGWMVGGRWSFLWLVPPAAALLFAIVPWRSRWLAWIVLADLLVVCAPLAFPQWASVLAVRPEARPVFPARLYLPEESASFLQWVYPGGRVTPESDARMLASGTAYSNLFARAAATPTPHPLKPSGIPALREVDPVEAGAAFRPSLRNGALAWEAVGGLPVVDPPPGTVEWTGRGLAFTPAPGTREVTLRFAPTPHLRVWVGGTPVPWQRRGPWAAIALGEGASTRVEVDFVPGWAVWLYGLSALCWAALLCYAIFEWRSPPPRCSA